MRVGRSYVANTILATLVAITTWALWSVGEQRVDVYVALYALEYTLVKAVLRPWRKGVDWLFIALLTLFFLCVGYRVYQVLTH